MGWIGDNIAIEEKKSSESEKKGQETGVFGGIGGRSQNTNKEGQITTPNSSVIISATTRTSFFVRLTGLLLRGEGRGKLGGRSNE